MNADGSAVVFSSEHERDPLSFVLGTSSKLPLPAALISALRTGLIRSGDRVRVVVPPAALNAKLRSDFPSEIPDISPVEFLMWVLASASPGVEHVDEEDSLGGAVDLKETGNQCFRNSRFPEALECYKCALATLQPALIEKRNPKAIVCVVIGFVSNFIGTAHYFMCKFCPLFC